MPRREFFYAAPAQIAGTEVQLVGAEHEHCARVLRKTVGEALTVVDGKGHAFDGVILGVEKKRTRVRIVHRRERVGEPRARLTLAQAVPKGNRFDWLVEKGTETGVDAFIPLLCERSEMTASSARRERWRRLALAAMKQSCRTVLPAVASAQSVEKLCAAVQQYDFSLLAHEERAELNATTLWEKLAPYKDHAARGLLLVGPEGGFSDSELEMARRANIQFVSFGPRRLRAETGGLVASTLVLAALGELD